MLRFIVATALIALGIGFLGWVGYVVYLGLKSFFGSKTDDK